jgi:hypothetical protein
MNFGDALEKLKLGEKLQRSGWNGKGMYIVLMPGYPDGVPINRATAVATSLPLGSTQRFLPYILMRTADGSFVPWLASQSDVLGSDWDSVVEPMNGPD